MSWFLDNIPCELRQILKANIIESDSFIYNVAFLIIFECFLPLITRK